MREFFGYMVIFGICFGSIAWKVYLSIKHPDTFREMEARKHEMKKTGLGLALKIGSRFIKK